MWGIWVAAATFVAFIVLLVVELVGGIRMQGRRRRAVQSLAQRLGLRYSKRARDLAHLRGLLDTLGQDPKSAENVLYGVWRGHQVHVFMTLILTSSFGGRWQRGNHFVCFLLEHRGRLPELLVAPPWPRWNVDLTRDRRKIQLESAEFSKAFGVRSRCPKLAYDICHPRMMEYLLANKDLTLQVVGNCLALYVGYYDRSLIDVEEIPDVLNQLVEIRELIPGFVLQTTYEEVE
ncbi:MAG: hypothetical protein FJ291_31610 [Planctomycetes bacterium]|nr:hypothetical protein [Planctomycetota bacterium]